MISIAIDGPSGAGKSTLSKRLAQELGFTYIDTGAMYRAIGHFILNSGADAKNSAQVAALLSDIEIKIKHIEGDQHIFVNSEDVTDVLRTQQVAFAASDVSGHAEVRAFLLDLQRNFATKHNVIMDGRDIGTVVLPNASLKIFLFASAEERALRRYLERSSKPNEQTLEEVLKDIITRDEQDMNRAVAPLKPAQDAVLVDTTGKSFDESFNYLLCLVKFKLGLPQLQTSDLFS